MPFSEILEPGGMGAGSPALSSPRLPLSLPPCAQSGCERRLLLSLPLTGGGRPGAPGGPPLVSAFSPQRPPFFGPVEAGAPKARTPGQRRRQVGRSRPPISNPSSLSHSKHTQTHHLNSSGLAIPTTSRQSPPGRHVRARGAGKVPGGWEGAEAHRRASSKVVYFLLSLCSVSPSVRPHHHHHPWQAGPAPQAPQLRPHPLPRGNQAAGSSCPLPLPCSPEGHPPKPQPFPPKEVGSRGVAESRNPPGALTGSLSRF